MEINPCSMLAPRLLCLELIFYFPLPRLAHSIKFESRINLITLLYRLQKRGLEGLHGYKKTSDVPDEKSAHTHVLHRNLCCFKKEMTSVKVYC